MTVKRADVAIESRVITKSDPVTDWVCETLEGDLHELYQKRRESGSRIKADFLFFIDKSGHVQESNKQPFFFPSFQSLLSPGHAQNQFSPFC